MLRPVWLTVRRGVPDPVKIELQRLRLARARRSGEVQHSPLRTPPELEPGRRPMRLTNVVIASDLHPDYIGFWPIVRRAWARLGIWPTLVLVAETVPLELQQYDVVHFEPLEGVPTALQAQLVRLLYPALIDLPGATLVADIDLVPLSGAYFHEPLAALDARFFVSYSDTDLPASGNRPAMTPIDYHAAEPATWADVFGIYSLEDVRARLWEWTRGVDFGGRGGNGWWTDQVLLRRALEGWPARAERHWLLTPQFTGARRFYRDRRVTLARRLLVRLGYYTDLHLPLEVARDLCRS